MPKKTAAKKTIELEQVWPKPVDVKAIRRRVKMSQAEFSRAYGISKPTLQEWEQGGRQPDSAARVPDSHSEKTRCGAPGTRQRMTHTPSASAYFGGCQPSKDDPFWSIRKSSLSGRPFP
jgi:DNA-binding XRE family transcriptional regulator